jgi:hypothetical protein
LVAGVIDFEPYHPDALPDGLCRAEEPRGFVVITGLTGQIGEDLEDVGDTNVRLTARPDKLIRF